MINLSSSKNLVNATSVVVNLAIHAVLLVVINVIILAVVIITDADMADTAETVVVEDLATALEVAMAELVVVAAGGG